MSFSISSHCHKRGSVTMLLICLTHYIHTYRPIGSDNLEWSIIRRTNPFTKIFHDDGITKLPTLQGSLGHLTAFLLDMCVPLLELLHDLRRSFKVLWIWFALMNLFRTVRKPQVVPAADRPKKVAQSTKQASFRVTLLRARLGLTVGMSPGLLVFGRHSSPRLWALRSPSLWRILSRLAAAGNFS